MLSYVLLTTLGLVIWYLVNTYRAFKVNLAAAKESGLPYICMPVFTFNPVWLVTHTLLLPLLRLLPSAWTESWIDYSGPDFAWKKQRSPFKELGCDIFILVAPGKNAVYVADPRAISQITTRRNDFPKPTWQYTSVDLFGRSVVSTEGAIWRTHRKITSPPFTEKNNVLVWEETLGQAESMMTELVGNADRSKTIWTASSEAMRLSLHVISRAGFGVSLHWPHEGADDTIPEGHTLTYKGALETLLHQILTIILTPRWFLKRSPFNIHKVACEGLTEWGKYMQEMYDQKKSEIKYGENGEGMDLLGALVKGAGISKLEGQDGEKGSKQLLTDEEILGNAFIFILAGHETAANTIHFSIMLLAMRMSSQRNLQKDLDSIFGDRPVSEWDYDEDLPKLFGSMCGAVMNEQLRLIPPVNGIPKCTMDAPQTLQVGDKRYVIPANSLVTLNSVATHRNPAFWPHTSEEDLAEFRPERWLETGPQHAEEDVPDHVEEGMEFEEKRPDAAASLFRPAKGAYIPFSEGYRSCLGRRFAQVEILAVLAVIFRTWTVELDVSMFLSDEDFAKATDVEKREAWDKANSRAKDLLANGMSTIITIQMRTGKIPFKFVKRGQENFKF
ncbi:related to cytochrome P450 3A7 [Ramularia collo-cygni]|uniref:Related to cytochrome P450 3A7 n=1 Tax=Ramularia collo-cygni TaxID=112498 RepID=A0A2D3UNX7_9PEZI|nr:related to cytochrome P450 3A7 [Ramularia collo-cygni]CZT14325.1 related to cytochrome P450 3A7 [Ramularia collo-cygni]